MNILAAMLWTPFWLVACVVELVLIFVAVALEFIVFALNDARNFFYRLIMK